ncbi:hypothetical protein ACFQX7_04540 [Luedemannella flava]|uniref:hypothetical protein n=1 Tax=Luedemannella flava TaxID=349316 RepID=UPI0031DFC50D
MATAVVTAPRATGARPTWHTPTTAPMSPVAEAPAAPAAHSATPGVTGSRRRRATGAGDDGSARAALQQSLDRRW